jgi:hypothetical protein
MRAPEASGKACESRAPTRVHGAPIRPALAPMAHEHVHTVFARAPDIPAPAPTVPRRFPTTKSSQSVARICNATQAFATVRTRCGTFLTENPAHRPRGRMRQPRTHVRRSSRRRRLPRKRIGMASPRMRPSFRPTRRSLQRARRTFPLSRQPSARREDIIRSTRRPTDLPRAPPHTEKSERLMNETFTLS